MISHKFPDINFIGNKQKLTSWICDNFPAKVKSVFDAFAGSSSVGYESKKRGLQVYSNDIMNINYCISNALIENSCETLNNNDIGIIFNGNIVKNGFMHEHYTKKYFLKTSV